jgi:hypothetical protein
VPWYENSCQVQHSEHTFGMDLMPPKPSRRKSIHHWQIGCPFQQSIIGVCLNLREVTALWWFNRLSDSSLNIMVLRRWYEQFRNRGCISHQAKGRAGRPRVTEETVKRVHKYFVQSPRNLCRTSRELQVLESTVRTNCNWKENWSLMIQPNDWCFVKRSWVWWNGMRVCQKDHF